MAFNPKKQAYNASINAVTLGVGEKSIVVGGENVLPFYTFDAPIANSPKIALEISDKGMESLQTAGMKAAFEGCATVADMAKKAEEIEGVSAVCLHFESADPNGENKSVEECVAMAKEVADATALPIIIMGCKNIEKDAEIFSKCSEALQGKNIVVLSAREEDYKTVGASAGMAYNQKVGAESAVDINLAKQLNVLLSQLGVPAQSILMNLGHLVQGVAHVQLAGDVRRGHDDGKGLLIGVLHGLERAGALPLFIDAIFNLLGLIDLLHRKFLFFHNILLMLSQHRRQCAREDVVLY